MDNCKNHLKVFQDVVLTSYPAQQRWICALCGEKGINREIGVFPSGPTYEDIEERFKNKVEE